MFVYYSKHKHHTMSTELLTAQYFYDLYTQLQKKSMDYTQKLTDEEWTRMYMYLDMSKHAAVLDKAKKSHEHRLDVYKSTLPLDTKAFMLAYNPK